MGELSDHPEESFTHEYIILDTKREWQLTTVICLQGTKRASRVRAASPDGAGLGEALDGRV
jgi:hypothetical protein